MMNSARSLHRWVDPGASFSKETPERFSVPVRPLSHLDRLHLGSCGWSFDEWQLAFYPRHLAPQDRLGFYSTFFGAVEVDTTFYHSPAKHVVQHWFGQTPGPFRFSIKMPRQITHQCRLRDCERELSEFLETVRGLGPKLACVLVQLPPSFSPIRDETALRQFVRKLPKDIRFAIDFRHLDWHLPRIVHLLEQHSIAWVWNDTAPFANQGRSAFDFLPQTTDFIYLRLLGDLRTELQNDGQRLHWRRDLALENWRLKLARHMDTSSDVFVFASNHFEGMAPMTCQRFAAVCGLSLPLPRPEPVLQMSLKFEPASV